MPHIIKAGLELFIITVFNIHSNLAFKDEIYFHSILTQKQNFSSTDEVAHVWMKILRGVYPNISTPNTPIKVGEPISILIYKDDQQQSCDIIVDECWTHSEPTLNTSLIKFKLISNKEEFATKNVTSLLVNKWIKKSKVGSQNVTLLYTYVTSFRFPAVKQSVYINCTIELYYNNSTLSNYSSKNYIRKEEKPSSIIKPNTKFFFNKRKPVVETYITTTTRRTNVDYGPTFTAPPPCYPDQEPSVPCHFITSKRPTHVHNRPYITTKKPVTQLPTTKITSQTENIATSCTSDASIDPRCATIFATKPTPATPPCSLNANDPRCKPTPPYKPSSTTLITHPTQSPCNSDMIDPRCAFESIPTATEASYKPVSTTIKPTTSCNSSYMIDSRCIFELISAITKPIYKPPSTSVQTTQSPCNSDGIDPRCASESSFTATKPMTTKLPPSPCDFDMIDPRCSKPEYKPIPSTIKPIFPDCSFETFDPRCVFETTSTTKYPYKLLMPPNCYPGSTDPRCNMLNSHKFESTSRPLYNPFKIPNCYPGSKDTRCMEKTTPSSIFIKKIKLISRLF